MNKYRQLERQQWQEVMYLVHICEAKYGSISETPEKDPTFIKIKKLCANNKAAGLTIDKQEKIVEQLKLDILEHTLPGDSMLRVQR